MDLMQLLPSVYDDNLTMQELQGILSDKMIVLNEDMERMIDQCFIDTVSDLISRYENLYGLTVDILKPLAARRERIKAKAKGIGTVTKRMLEDVAASYANGEVEVIEHPVTNNFIVKFVGIKGIPANMSDLTLTIEEIKPAHLSFSFEYTYNIWNSVKDMTWQEATAYSWEQLRTR